MKGFFEPLENTRPFLKMAFQGFQGSGKSHTSMLVACGLHDKINSKRPIAIYYTEGAGKGTMADFFQEKGKEAEIREGRTLADLSKAIDICEKGFSDILIIDSITHVWENFINAYMQKYNRRKLMFHDWNIIKPQWNREFSYPFIMSQLHIIFTGRAGNEYQHIEDEQGNLEIQKTGEKMKVGGDTAYEPDIVVSMDQERVFKNKQLYIKRRALILKDRSRRID